MAEVVAEVVVVVLVVVIWGSELIIINVRWTGMERTLPATKQSKQASEQAGCQLMNDNWLLLPIAGLPIFDNREGFG